MSGVNQGKWETVTNERKRRAAEGRATKAAADPARDRLGVAVDSGAFAAFDRAFASRAAAERAAAEAEAASEGATYRGAFSGLVQDDASAAAAARRGGSSDGDGSDGAAESGTGAAVAAQRKPKAPKAPRKPRVTVAAAAAAINVPALQVWMADVQRRYGANETAQVRQTITPATPSFPH